MNITKNKGYSLVEMIIVLAIIAILSGLSLISVSIINTARAKQASTVFGDEVSAIHKKDVSMNGKIDMTDPIDPTNTINVETRYGLVLYKEDGNFKISEVELYNNSINPGGSDFWKFVRDGSDVRVNNTDIISSRVDIKFTGYYTSFQNGEQNTNESGVVQQYVDYSPNSLDSTESVCIMFDKHGNCLSGYGKYDFYKNGSNKVASVYVRQNGSIEIR